MNKNKDKKKYKKPEISVYGNVREITQNAAAMGAADGGMMDNKDSTA